MSHRCLAAALGVLAAVSAVVWLAPVPVAGQAPTGVAKTAGATKDWAPPRTPWGAPDLQGMWDTRTRTPLERPKEFGTREFMTDQEAAERARRGGDAVIEDEDASDALEKADVRRAAQGDAPDDGRPGYRIAGAEYNAFWSSDPSRLKASRRTSQVVDPPDGRIPPLTREVLTRFEAREAARRGRGESDSWEDRNVMERCLMRPGLPGEMIGSGQFPAKEIVQAPGQVTFVMSHGYVRIVPLDGRPHVGRAIRQWNGDSRGRWEGNTLVVETTNFNDKQNGGPIMASRRPLVFYLGSGETLRVVERFTRLDPETIDYSYTVDDPKVYVRPWTAVNTWTLDDKQDRIFEYACHEHNYGMVNLLKGGRANQKLSLEEAAREVPPRQKQIQAEWEKLRMWEAAQRSSR